MREGLNTKIEQKITTKPKQFSYTTNYFLKKKIQMDRIFERIKPDLIELSDYFSPRTCRFLTSDVYKPVRKAKKILNSVTLTAVRNFASGMQSGATSATSRWFRLQMQDKDFNQVYEVRKWCYKQEELTRQLLATSNFYQLMMGIYKDLGVYSFGCLAMQTESNGSLVFTRLPIGSYRYSKNSKGIVDTLCRTYCESVKNLVDTYGYENCSKNVKDAFDNNVDALVEICFFVEPNKEYNQKSPLARHKKYISVVFETGKEGFLSVSGYEKFPFAVFEAEVNGEDNYPSNCPALEALPDAKQLMMQQKEYAKGIKKLVTPTYKGPASLQKTRGLIDAPGQIIPEDESGRGLSPIYEINPRILELKQNNDELAQKIQEHFYNDLFAVILNSAERGRTATEVNEVKEEKMVLLSPILDQVHKGLRVVLDWIFWSTFETGIMPTPPSMIDLEKTKMEFVSALAMAQKVKGIASIERYTTFVTNLANSTDMTIKKKLNLEKIIDDYADIANINPEYVVSNEELKKIRKEMEAQTQQQIQFEQAKQGTEIVKNLGGIDSFGADLVDRMGAW